MNRRFTLSVLLCSLLLGAGGGVAAAQQGPYGAPPRMEREADDDDDGERRLRRGGQTIPLPVLIAQLQQRTGGDFVSANPTQVGGRDAYWIRMRFPGGRFEDFYLDARTGRHLSGHP